MSAVVIGIVSFNSEQYIEACIGSALRQSHSCRVVVFDNCSTDSTVQRVLRFDDVALIVSPVNVGFGKGHNHLIGAGQCDYYVPLNPDCILDECFVAHALESFASGDVGAVNGLVQSCSESEGGQRVYSCGHILYRDRRIENLYYGRNIDDVKPFDKIFGPNGACPILKRQMIDDISIDGLFFEPLFFMYGEDVDIGWRMIKAGWKTIFNPQCIAWHAIGGSKPFKNSVVRVDYIANRYLLLFKLDHLQYFLRDLFVFAFVEAMFIGVHFIRRPSFLFDQGAAMIKVVRNVSYIFAQRKKVVCRLTPREESEYILKPILPRIAELIARQLFPQKRFHSF